MSRDKFQALTPGQIVQRRFDKSRWRVLSVSTRDREDSAAQQIFGSVTEVKLRRISPDIVTSHEPLTWDEWNEEEVA